MQYSSSSTNQKAGGSTQSRQCIKWSFWGLTVLWCEHKWNLWEDLKHDDLSLTGQTSYHSKAIFYLHKYIFLPLCCCFDSVVFNTLLNMAWVFPSRHPDICCLCFLDCGIYVESFFITQLVPHSALSFCDSLSSLHSQNNPSLCCSRFSVPLFQLSFQFSLNYHHSPGILLRFRMSSKHRSCCLHTPGNALDCFFIYSLSLSVSLHQLRKLMQLQISSQDYFVHFILCNQC